MNFDRKQRFSIRKYSIGVASVLIGSVLAGTTIASADTEVKIDDASKAPVTSTQEAPKVSAVSAQEASMQEAPTYSANAALVSTEKAEAPKVEAKTETPAKEQASQAEVKENAKDSKNEAKTEETVSEVKAPETEVKSEESEVKEAEKKADSTDKKSEDKPVDLKKEQLDVDKKVPGLDLKNATENPDGGFNIAFSKEAQEQYRASLEAYIARRRNYNRRSSFRAAGADTSTDPDYEFKKVMTPILPGFYADQESIRSLVIDPNNVGDFNFDVWYKKLGSIVLVDEQGNYITPTGETTANQADAAHKQYENDPSDPTRAWFTKVPTIPTGWEVKPGQNVYGYDAARQTVNPNQKDDLDAIGRDTKIVIVKQAQKAIIKYVNENGNVELGRDEVVGKSGEAIDYSTNEKVSSYRRRGFELVSDGFYDAANKNFDFDASVDQEFTVVLRERIEPIDPDKPTPTPDKPVDPNDPDTPKWPDPVKDIVNKDDVTRTVKYVYEDGSKAKEDVSETLHFKRFAYVNLVTGHIDYRPWTTTDDTFDAVTSPVIKGYTADKLVVPAVSGVQAGAADTVEVVTYVKDAQKAIIKYVNEKGNVELSRDAVAGKSGEAINYSTAAKISSYKRQGYELVSDGFTSASSKNFDFDASVDQEFTVVLRERIEPIDPDKPTPTPDKPVDPNDPDTPKWPDPVKDIVNKDDVTRTVKYVYEDGSKAKEDVSETLHFKRFAYVNLVTGHIDYRPWTTTDDTFDAVTSPVIKGYTADKLVVPAVSGVQAGAADTVEVVTYVKDAQKAIIKYVNEKGNVELSRDEVLGKSGDAINYSTATKISSYKRQGYELVSDGFTSASNKNFDFDTAFDQEFTVVLRERIEPIDPDKPTPTPDKPVDPNDPDTPKWPDPVKDIVNKDDVTRTVKYVYEDGSKAKEDVSETLHFKRFAYVNLVTGHIDYRPWTTTDDTFDAVTSPVIKGYTADKLVVPAVSGVQAGAADTVEVVTYVKDAQKAIIKYVNEKGNVELSRDAVAGKSGEAINYSTAAKISSYKRQGYELVSDGFTSASSKNFDFDASVDQEFTVVLRERIEPIDPDKPTPTPDKPVDPNDPDTPKWPDPVKDIVNKDDVTRTVKYVYEDGSKAKEDVSETLHFKRFAYVNLVTGHIDYRPWTTTDDTFDAVTSPVIKGYTADKLVVPAVSGVQAGAADTVEVVTYVKDAQKAIIKYVNENGNVEVARDTVNGKSGEVIAYTTTDKINELHRKGYELVSDGFTSASSKNFDFDASVDQEFTVVVRERVVPVGPEDPDPTPDTPYDPTDPNTPNWPKNVDKIQNRRAVATRTIRYFVEENGVTVPKPIRERVVFERTVLVNLVTGEMTPQAWKLVSVTRLDNEVENKPVVRTRRALSEGLAPRALETSLARPASHTRSRRSLVIADSPEESTESTVSLSAVNPEPVVATRSARRSRRSLSTASTTPTVTPGTVLPNVPTPVVEGFYSTVGAIPPVEITPEGELKFDYDVWFKKLGHIQLVDQNGNVLAETIYKNNVTDATKAAPTALPAIPAGYKIKEGQTVYGYDATAGTVDPNNPTDPDAIGRNTTILLELQAVPRQETKVVNETIHYKDAITGETLAPDHTDQVTFRRVVMVNPATNEVLSATSWVADNGDTTFDAVTSPVIEGYEASPLVVDAITGLTAESKDFVTTVLYRKKAVPTPQPDPVKPDPVKPDPVKPDPVKPDPVKPEPTKPATPDAPKAPALPETGVTDASTVTLLGAALGLVGLAGLAKRKRDENE